MFWCGLVSCVYFFSNAWYLYSLGVNLLDPRWLKSFISKLLNEEFLESSNLFGLLLSWWNAEFILNGYFISLITVVSYFSSTDAFFPEVYFPFNFFLATSFDSFLIWSSSKVSIMLFPNGSKANYFVSTLPDFG